MMNVLNVEEDINQQVLDFAMREAQASASLARGINVADACIYAQVGSSVNHTRWYVEVEYKMAGLKCSAYVLYRVWMDEEYRLHAISIGAA
jgi:hypothetical protein